MMWGYGTNMGWMWLWGLLVLIGIALVVLVADQYRDQVRVLGEDQ